MGCHRGVMALLVLTGIGCTTDVPGDEIGTYRIQMKLVQNTCGPFAVHSQDGHRYTAQLRADGDRGYWRISGQPVISGDYEAGRFRFDYSAIVAHSAPDASVFCQLQQADALSGGVALDTASDGGVDSGTETVGTSALADAGELPDEGLVGTHTLTISGVPGTDCTEALPPAGPFQQLPCVVTYSLTGTPTESF